MNIDKPWIDYIANRTFGMELEFADGEKQRIPLPSGYKWTDNKLTMMNNSDGSAVTHHGQFGGEINTRPYHYCMEDLQELKDYRKITTISLKRKCFTYFSCIINRFLVF